MDPLMERRMREETAGWTVPTIEMVCGGEKMPVHRKVCLQGFACLPSMGQSRMPVTMNSEEARCV